MPYRSVVFASASALVTVLACAIPAYAQPFAVSLTSSLSANVTNATPPVEESHVMLGPVPGPLSTGPTSHSRTSATGHASVTGSAAAEQGRLSGALSAAAGSTSSPQVAATGGIVTVWTDTVTVTAPPGTFARLRARLIVTGGSVSASPPAMPGDCGPATAFVAVFVNLGPYGGLTFSRDTCGSSDGVADQFQDFDVTVVHEPLVIEGSLQMIAQAIPTDPSTGGPLPSVSATADPTTATFQLDILSTSTSLTTASGVSYSSGAPPPPAVPVTALQGVVSPVRAGDFLRIGVTATNPSGQPDAQLFTGALLPDGSTVVFLSGPNVFGRVGSLAAPAGFLAQRTVAAGSSYFEPNLLVVPVPPPSTLPPGIYRVFSVLAPIGAFADNTINPGDILDIRPITVLP
jgi:hypothetical protein